MQYRCRPLSVLEYRFNIGIWANYPIVASLEIFLIQFQQPGEETEERGNLAERAAAAVSKNDEEHEIVLEKYHRGISHVEGLLKLDKLRQVSENVKCI